MAAGFVAGRIIEERNEPEQCQNHVPGRKRQGVSAGGDAVPDCGINQPEAGTGGAVGDGERQGGGPRHARQSGCLREAQQMGRPRR